MHNECGAELISRERDRQITSEGWDSHHDKEHFRGELVQAAVCYALYTIRREPESLSEWPWSPDWWKPKCTAVRMLVKAGALIAAEIDRRLLLGETNE